MHVGRVHACNWKDATGNMHDATGACMQLKTACMGHACWWREQRGPLRLEFDVQLLQAALA